MSYNEGFTLGHRNPLNNHTLSSPHRSAPALQAAGISCGARWACYATQVIKLYSIHRSADLALGPKARTMPAQGIALGRRKPMKNHILPSLLSQTLDQGSGV